MSLSRIIFPIVAALTVTAGLVTFFWWEVKTAPIPLQDPSHLVGDTLTMPTTTVVEDPIDTGDASLLHLRQGDLDAIRADWANAEIEYSAAVDAGGGLTALRKLAQSQLQRRDIDALRLTMKKLKDQGLSPDDLLLLDVIVNLRSGEMVKAKEQLDKAAEAPQKHYGLALLDIIQGNNDAAKVELAAVENGWDPVLRTYAKTLKGAYDEYALYPESPAIHLTTLLSRALAEVQECELALPLLNQVLAQQDDYRDGWIVQGYCDLTTERFEEALSSFERAYALDSEKPEIQYFLGRSYSMLSDHKNALTFLQYAQKNGFQPEKEVRSLIVEEAEKSGDMQLALEQQRAIVALSDADVSSYASLVALAISTGGKDEAFTVATSAVQKWPSDARAYDILGDAAAASGRTAEAKSAWEKALQMSPSIKGVKEKLQKL